MPQPLMQASSHWAHTNFLALVDVDAGRRRQLRVDPQRVINGANNREIAACIRTEGNK